MAGENHYLHMPEVNAPYVETDIRMLGDSHLDPAENVIKQREELLSSAGKYRIYGQDELENPDRGLGPKLQFTELISRLKAIAPTLKAIDGSEGNIALYFPRTKKDYEDTVREWDWEHDQKQDPFFRRMRYVGGFPKDDLPEYSTVDIDTSKLPTREKRGWRSVLITIIKQGVASYQDVISQFGDVGTDKRGWRWNEQLRPWKQRQHERFKQETQENR